MISTCKYALYKLVNYYYYYYYFKIYAVIRRHANQINALQQSAQNEDVANVARLRKTAVATFYVYLVFLVCYLPIFCTGLARIHGETPLLSLLWEFTYTFVYLNSSLQKIKHLYLSLSFLTFLLSEYIKYLSILDHPWNFSFGLGGATNVVQGDSLKQRSLNEIIIPEILR